MSTGSVNLGLPYMAAAQAQKHVTHNQALEQLDMIVQLSLQSFSKTVPPLDPDEGQVWAIGTGAVNDWAGHDGALAGWSNGGWIFITPKAGWRAVLDTEQRVFDGADWVSPDLPDIQNVPGVGVNTSYDSTNRLVVASEAVLFTNVGDDIQLKVNKAATGDTASLLFQTGYSGRAEMGTLGDDNFAVKVSPDGSAWTTAFSVDATTGATTMGQLLLSTALSPAQGGTGVANNAAATLTRSGNHALTFTTTATTSVTFPTSGTLATLAGAETLSNKTLPSPVINTLIGGTAPQRLGGLRCTYGGTANAITLTYGLPSLVTGVAVRFRATSANTGAATINLDGLGTVTCVTVTGAALPSGYIRTDADTSAYYDGTNWVLDRQIVRGSNSNGEYVRYAGGTQICTRRVTGLGPVATASGSIFTTASSLSGLTWAAAFAALPVVSFSTENVVSGTQTWVIVGGSGSTTGIPNTRIASAISTGSTDFILNITAIGRWF